MSVLLWQRWFKCSNTCPKVRYPFTSFHQNMGRPLFSQSYLSEPVVRTEPEPSVPPYEKWSYWNPFDPDSDEFFTNPVYAAFISLPPSPGPEDHQTDIPLISEPPHTPISTETTLTDRRMVLRSGIPMMFTADSQYWDQALPRQVPSTAFSHHSPPPDMLYTPSFIPPDPETRIPETRVSVRGRSATITIFRPQPLSPASPPQNFVDNLPRTSNITPIPIPTRTVVPNTPTPQPGFLPSTPPSQMISPSPAPSVSPRILSWPTRAPLTPSPSGPLTNPNARMSLAHIAPAPIPVSDFVV